MFWDDDEEIDFDVMTRLYQLRHAINVLGAKKVAEELEEECDRLEMLVNSSIHGSADLLQFLDVSHDEFQNLFAKHEEEALERLTALDAAQRKNERLVAELKRKRTDFAGIGTNKAKRRLNKLAENDPLAKAVRLALEIEDKSISAKNSYGKYQDKIYKQKNKFIMDLCELFKKQGWGYGTHKSDSPPTSHVIYFDIPGCEQVSWHFSPEKDSEIPVYDGKWDKKKNSTVRKLETLAGQLLHGQMSLPPSS